MPRSAIDWDVVYITCLPRIYHFFCYKTGDVYHAEELTAITFEKAWSSRRNFRNEAGDITGWLIGIARHVAADHFRNRKRENALEQAYMKEGLEKEDAWQHRLEFHEVIRLLRTYPVREQELIALKYGAELNNRQIAAITGLSESNVGTLLHRIITRLRDEMEIDDEKE